LRASVPLGPDHHLHLCAQGRGGFPDLLPLEAKQRGAGQWEGHGGLEAMEERRVWEKMAVGQSEHSGMDSSSSRTSAWHVRDKMRRPTSSATPASTLSPDRRSSALPPRAGHWSSPPADNSASSGSVAQAVRAPHPPSPSPFVASRLCSAICREPEVREKEALRFMPLSTDGRGNASKEGGNTFLARLSSNQR
jgi:hypothetical protein